MNLTMTNLKIGSNRTSY